jgi:hypothetical protein
MITGNQLRDFGWPADPGEATVILVSSSQAPGHGDGSQPAACSYPEEERSHQAEALIRRAQQDERQNKGNAKGADGDDAQADPDPSHDQAGEG